MPGVITVSDSSWIAPFTGLSPRQFGKLVTLLQREGADAVCKGRSRGPSAGGPGAAGHGVLADERDDAADRPAVRHLEVRSPQDHRPSR